MANAPVLKARANGAWVEIPAIRGEKGERGKALYRDVVLEAALWSSNGGSHVQTPTIEGVTGDMCVNLCLNATNLQACIDEKYALAVVNNNGVVTFYAVGNVPTQNITLQVQMIEVEEE